MKLIGQPLRILKSNFQYLIKHIQDCYTLYITAPITDAHNSSANTTLCYDKNVLRLKHANAKKIIGVHVESQPSDARTIQKARQIVKFKLQIN